MTIMRRARQEEAFCGAAYNECRMGVFSTIQTNETPTVELRRCGGIQTVLTEVANKIHCIFSIIYDEINI